MWRSIRNDHEQLVVHLQPKHGTPFTSRGIDYKGNIFKSTLPLESAYPFYYVQLGTNNINHRM